MGNWEGGKWTPSPKTLFSITIFLSIIIPSFFDIYKLDIIRLRRDY